MNQSQPTKYEISKRIEQLVMEEVDDIKFVKVNIGCKNCCRIFVRLNWKAQLKHLMFRDYCKHMLHQIYNLIMLESTTSGQSIEIHLTYKSMISCDIQ